MNVKDCIGKKVVFKLNTGDESNYNVERPLREGTVQRVDDQLVKIDNEWFYANGIVVEKVLNEGSSEGKQVIEG